MCQVSKIWKECSIEHGILIFNISHWNVSNVSNFNEIFFIDNDQPWILNHFDAFDLTNNPFCDIHKSFSANPNWNYDSTFFCLDEVCFDSLANNYTPEADFSLYENCQYDIIGCADSSMFNYNPQVNIVDNESCVEFIPGCTDSLYTEFDPFANAFDDSCFTLAINGCTDNGIGLNGLGQINDIDGDGLPSLNFDPLANQEDGSCIPLLICSDDETSIILNIQNPDSLEAVQLSISDEFGILITLFLGFLITVYLMVALV